MMTNNQNKKQPIGRMMLACEPCGYRRVIEPKQISVDKADPRLAKGQLKVDELAPTECKSSPVQLSLPTLDPTTNKTVASKFLPQPVRYKCPQCGRPVKLKTLMTPLAAAFTQRDDADTKKRLEEEKLKRQEDGKPVDKKTNLDFLG
jgi:DNA-directed RNA polymerase subunit RPC12/RpoP